MAVDQSGLPDWAKRLTAAVSGALTAATADVPHPQQSTDKAGAGKGGAAAASSGLGAYTQYWPYAAALAGVVVLLKMRKR